MGAPTYQSTISALSAIVAAGGYGRALVAFELREVLQDAVAQMTATGTAADPNYTTWASQYQQSAAETDRAARFCVTQLACSGGVAAAVIAAFGVASSAGPPFTPGIPAALPTDPTNNEALVTRVAAANLLLNSGATPVNPQENVAGMSTWLNLTNSETEALLSSQPPGAVTTSPAYATAVAAVAAANANGAAFIAAGSFQ